MSKSSEAVIRWRKRTKQLIVESMGNKCQICNYDKCIEALDLHHINPNEKEISFGEMRANPQALDKICKELEKCILLCCRCHREYHYGITKLPDNYSKLNFYLLFKSKIELEERKIEHKRKQSEATKNWHERRKKIKLTNEEIYDKLINEHKGNKSSLAKELNVSEAAIRKRIKIYKQIKEEKQDE